MLTTTIALAEDHRNELLEEARQIRVAGTGWRAGRGGPRRRRGGETGDTRRRRLPAALLLVGVAFMGVSAGTLAAVSHPAHTDARVPAASDAEGRFPDVGIAGSTYPPGHSSGWHTHPGVHSVVVLKGALTVYDEHCARSEFQPGQTYLGGAAPHLARNETADVLDVAITYVYRPVSGDHGAKVAPPLGCEIR